MSIENCSKCGNKGYSFHKHHKDRNHKNNNPNNVVILCSHCHGKEHGIEGGGLQDSIVDTMVEISERRLSLRLKEGFGLLSSSGEY